MKYAIGLTSIMITILLLAGCSSNELQEEQKQVPDMEANFCSADSDCVCGGVDAEDRCFLGNKEYYNKYVDKTKDCPDFCGGIDGRLTVKCVDSKCVQMYGCITDAECDAGQSCVKNRCVGEGCSNDKDCVKGGCSGTVCSSRGNDVMTTCEWKEEYACYRSAECGCVERECRFRDQASIDNCLSAY